VLHHIANGMFGMVIVEPEGGLPPVDNEFFFVQHEWYLGPQGEPASFDAANQAAPAPDFQMFNGVASQYADNPIAIPTGESVRMFVLNTGPSIDTSFHVVGTIFRDVIKEGVHLAAGNEGNWGSQAVDLAPAQGALIEMTTAEDGTYASSTTPSTSPAAVRSACSTPADLPVACSDGRRLVSGVGGHRRVSRAGLSGESIPISTEMTSGTSWVSTGFFSHGVPVNIRRRSSRFLSPCERRG
jgi:hypothetical protein